MDSMYLFRSLLNGKIYLASYFLFYQYSHIIIKNFMFVLCGMDGWCFCVV